MKTLSEPLGTGASARTSAQPRRMYKAVPLGAQASGALNDSSQVAFTERLQNGQTAAKFFDGETIHDLGTLGGASAVAAALNNAEQIAGHANFDAGALTHAYRWSASTGMADLGTIRGGAQSQATDLNNMGDAVGLVLFADQRPPHAALWRSGARPIDLGLNAGVSPLLLINDMRQVMGNTVDANGRSMAFVWTPATGLIALTGADIVDSESRDINALGQVTGSFTCATAGGPGAYLWTPGQEFIRLFEQAAFPFALNDSAMVVGVLMDQVAFVWTREGGMLNIGALPGGGFSNAYDVNNHDEVVGQAANADSLRAFLWTRDDGMVDLNDRLIQPPSGLVLSIATHINDNGSILALSSTNALVLLLPFPH